MKPSSADTSRRGCEGAGSLLLLAGDAGPGGGGAPSFSDHPASLPSCCGQAVWSAHGLANTWNCPFFKILLLNLVPDGPSLGFDLQTSGVA